MATFTKGNWEVQEGDFGYKVICDKTNPDDTVDIAEINDYNENADEPKANAHLIRELSGCRVAQEKYL